MFCQDKLVALKLKNSESVTLQGISSSLATNISTLALGLE